jgi:glycosyltransferase involved in cell wall biosynthesis
MPDSALFLTPELPLMGTGGGGLRSASLLEYLRTKYEVELATFTLPHHEKHFAARVWRNAERMVRGVPPLFDRYSGFEEQLKPVLEGKRYRVAVVEHFWCASYAAALRPHCDVLVLDLHNVESELAATHARAVRGFAAILHRRFAEAYRRLETEWIPKFDVVLTTSGEDRARVAALTDAVIYPNALPRIDAPRVRQENCVIFSGNLEYHPNMEAVRWFAAKIWPRLRASNDGLTWKLVGRNPEAVAALVKGDPRIVFTGPVEDAVAAIAQARVVVVPLLSGSGTRFKILEAWAGERAVVSTKIGAEGLGARDGEHLLLANDAAHFMEAVQAVLNDADLAEDLGTAGRVLYEDRFTWPAAWKKLEARGI